MDKPKLKRTLDFAQKPDVQRATVDAGTKEAAVRRAIT